MYVKLQFSVTKFTENCIIIFTSKHWWMDKWCNECAFFSSPRTERNEWH